MLNTMITALTRREALGPRASDETGAGIVEYLLLVVFIALILIVALVFFSGTLGDAFSDAANSVTG